MGCLEASLFEKMQYLGLFWVEGGNFYSCKMHHLLAADHWWGSKKELFLSQPALIICHHCHLQQCSPVFITNPDLTAKYSDS